MTCRKNNDKCLIKNMLQDVVENLGDAVVLKIVATSIPGDPAKGIGNTYTFTLKQTRAVIDQVNQTDILNSGGIYLVGDIVVQLKERLREVVDKVGHIGDRMIWDGYEYRIVGKRWPETLQGVSVVYKYTMRKVDDK